MKTNNLSLSLRSLSLRSLAIRSALPTLMCCALALPVLTVSEYAAAADKKPLVELAQKKQVVSINKANAETIANILRGVGFKKAQAIVEWRKKNGGFTKVSQLLEVKGIGEKTLAANKGRIKL
ncbi:MAG: ComEA family DNA-binding protein [Cellvibrionaceae bacterium]